MQHSDVDRHLASSRQQFLSKLSNVLLFLVNRLVLDKSLLMKVFGYLRLSELVVASQVCSYFANCYRSLWSDKEFFGQFETDKFTSEELGKVIKLARLDHIRQLRQIYSGKNIRHCR